MAGGAEAGKTAATAGGEGLVAVGLQGRAGLRSNVGTWAVELEASVVGCVAAEALASLEQLHTLHAHPPAPKHIPRHIGHGDLRAGS